MGISKTCGFSNYFIIQRQSLHLCCPQAAFSFKVRGEAGDVAQRHCACLASLIPSTEKKLKIKGMGKCGEQLFHTIYTGLPHTGRSVFSEGRVRLMSQARTLTHCRLAPAWPASCSFRPQPGLLHLASCSQGAVSSWHTAATRDPDDTVLRPELARLRGHLRQPLWQPEACIFLTTPCCSCYKAPTPRRLAGAWPRPAGPGLETWLPERFCSKATTRTMSH